LYLWRLTNRNPQMEGPKLIIFTAPSGAGKTTLVRHLFKVRDDIAFSISATTRHPRYEEVNGRDYFFLTETEFRKKIEEKDFLEWEEVYEGQLYGTMKSQVDMHLAMGKSVIFDIDVKGAVNIQKHYPNISLSIFVKPPTPQILTERLKNRKTEDEESIKKRINRARHELTFERKFDISLVNDDLQTALKEAETIVDQFIKTGKK